MQNDVDRKTTALVTGGSRGIGRAVAVALAEAGVNHIFVGYLQRESEAAETVRQIEANGVSATAVAANLGYPQEIEKLFETVATVSSRLDYFVHCAPWARSNRSSMSKPINGTFRWIRMPGLFSCVFSSV